MLILNDDRPEDLPQRLLCISRNFERHGIGKSDCDLPPIKVGYSPISITYSHEEHALASHECPVIQPWFTKSKSIAELITVQPAAVRL